ncbi:MAG: glutathione S-transferase family protein [Thermoleophilaceae bacterium]
MHGPLLWHLKVSPYNEKARWALDYKRVPHVRRAVTPIGHAVVSRRVGGRGTMPVLAIDGRAIGDSSEIIAELERRAPVPRLYPADPAERARALELEDLFDEQLGPYMRRLVLHHALRDSDLLLGAFTPDLRRPVRAVVQATFPLSRRKLRHDFRIDDRTVDEAFGKLASAGERMAAEVGPGGYLVGDSFSVADLALASLCAPAVAPPQFPYPQPQRGHRLFAPLREALDRAGLLEFTLRMYELHRVPS